jgi:hypothetical protein
VGPHTETIEVEVRAQNIQQVVGQVNKRLDHFEAANFSFLQIGRAQKFTDDFVLIEEDASGANRQLLDTSFSRMGIAVDATQTDSGSASGSADSSVVLAIDAQASSSGQAAPISTSFFSRKDDGLISVQAGRSDPKNDKSSAGLRLYSGQATLITRQFVFPYKQVAVALAAIVFATPIYTRSAQSREVTGPLVMQHERMTELLEHQQALDTELIDLPRVR